MVREARISWDPRRPLPTELSRKDWDSDDPDDVPETKPRRRRRSGVRGDAPHPQDRSGPSSR